MIKLSLNIQEKILKIFLYRIYYTTLSWYFVYDSIMSIVGQTSKVARGPLISLSDHPTKPQTWVDLVMCKSLMYIEDVYTNNSISFSVQVCNKGDTHTHTHACTPEQTHACVYGPCFIVWWKRKQNLNCFAFACIFLSTVEYFKNW